MYHRQSIVQSFSLLSTLWFISLSCLFGTLPTRAVGTTIDCQFSYCPKPFLTVMHCLQTDTLFPTLLLWPLTNQTSFDSGLTCCLNWATALFKRFEMNSSAVHGQAVIVALLSGGPHAASTPGDRKSRSKPTRGRKKVFEAYMSREDISAGLKRKLLIQVLKA